MNEKFKIPNKYDYHDWGVLFNTKSDGIEGTLEYEVYLWCRRCGAIRMDEVLREGRYEKGRFTAPGKRSPTPPDSLGYVRRETSAKIKWVKLPLTEQKKKKETRICKK